MRSRVITIHWLDINRRARDPGATMLLRLWKFVRNVKNREILSWLGGGAVVIVAGTWTLFIYLHGDNKPTASTTTVIASAATGITSGRDTVVNAPVNIGLNEKQVGQQVSDAQKPLTDELARLVAQVARDKGVEIAPLRAILGKLGEAGVRDEDIPKRLDEKADELIKLREEIAKLHQGPTELVSYAQQAQALIDKGDFDGARIALAAGRTAARGLREQSLRYETQYLAQDAKVDHLQLAYRSASTKYADAAHLMENVDQRQQWEFLLAQAGELYGQGYEFADNLALAESITVYRNALSLAPRAHRSLDWAQTQNNLGMALFKLGRRESNTARLEEAIVAFRDALTERTRAWVPLDWAETQNNLGAALAALADRESGTARLDEAIAAYRNALMEQSRARTPLAWAETQSNLGNALLVLGYRDESYESGTARLWEAIIAFRDALMQRPRTRVPLEWAETQYNIGNALRALGVRQKYGGTARLQEAVAAYRDALMEYTRVRVPLAWAMTQNSLGLALLTIGERENEMAGLREAVVAFRDALMEDTRARVPLSWATIQSNLGDALFAIGVRENGTVRLEEAVAAYRDALMERTRERVPLDWAWSTGDQGVALRVLAERRGDLAMAEQALGQITVAFETFRDAHHAPGAAGYEADLPFARALVERLRKG